jgi:hypothetical protein
VDSVNVTRMRKRVAASVEASERRQWLDAMTPEHREWHEQGDTFGRICQDCVRENMRAIGSAMESMTHSLRASAARRRSAVHD